MITRKEFISKYLKFFESKGHKIIPSASLIPSNDPTVLFTTAGMHPLVPYLLGQPHPLGKRLANVQKCIRTTDIDEVGDETHHTFFEMLGNWSLGDYWKEDAIRYSYEFLTKILKIPHKKISVTCFKGDKNAPKDTESEKTWKSLGIKKIKFLGKEDNWWGPAGGTGPCGPDTEMFVNGVEIWNDVFMQYNKTKDEKFLHLQQKNVDTGMGVERTLAILNGFDDNYLTDVWKPIIEKIEKLSGKKYGKDKETTKAMRIIADHIKAAVFIIGDGVKPGKEEKSSILRILIRKAIRQGRRLNLEKFTNKIAESIFEVYDDYKELHKNKKEILNILEEEEDKFDAILINSPKIISSIIKDKKTISGKDALLLYQSYGIPKEVTEEISVEKGVKVEKDFENKYREAFQEHMKLSGSSALGTFKSGLADNSENTTKLHTATHLLNEALRKVLGSEIRQKGSNITPERLRFDFNFPRKLTDEEIKSVEKLVNDKIKENLEVKRSEMALKDALKSGAQSEFGAKYPDVVSVYSIGNFSKEICTGPHVKSTSEIGKFKIIKEESSAAGIRRIKAVME